MGQTLTNGIYLPAEGERNCYEGLAANWTALDGLIGGYNAHIGNTTIHVTAADKEAWNGKADASALTAHTGDTTIHVTAEDKATWNGKADASALTAHTGDTTIHVTAEDKQAWDGHVADTTIHVTSADKQTWNSHVADTTIHVTSADKQAWNGKADNSALTAHTGDTTIHVTAADKAKWDAVTSKADDSDVVHKSGNETIGDTKTFSEDIIISNSDTSQTSKRLIIRSSKVNLGDSNSDSWGITFNAGASYVAVINSEKYSNSTQGLSFNVRTRDTDNNLISASYRLRIYTNGSANLMPDKTDSISLGSSDRRWKDVQTYLFNGINPGALFLPQDRTAHVDISAYFTNTANGATNRVTSPEDGYIYLAVTDVVTIHCFSQNASNLTHYGQTFARPSAGQLHCLFPVRKNDNVAVQWYTTAAAVTVSNAFFIPCKGNI